MRWKFAIFPWSAYGNVVELREMTGVKHSVRLGAPTTTTFSIDGRAQQAPQLQELVTDLLVTIMGYGNISRLRCGGLQDDLSEDTHKVNASFVDYRGVLKRRKLRSTDTLLYTATDQGSIVSGMIGSVQGRTNGSYGITNGTGVTTGVTRTVQLAEGEFVGERIEQLANSDNGFDWDLEPTLTTEALKLNMWAQRGSNNGIWLEYGRSVSKATRTRNAANFANDVLTTGGATTTPVQSDGTTVGTDTTGRWDAVISYNDVNEQAVLNDRAAFNITNLSALRPVYNVTLLRGFWQGPGHIWIGDTVGLNVRSGRINEQLTDLRVMQMDFDISEDNDEIVSLVLGYQIV